MVDKGKGKGKKGRRGLQARAERRYRLSGTCEDWALIPLVLQLGVSGVSCTQLRDPLTLITIFGRAYVNVQLP